MIEIVGAMEQFSNGIAKFIKFFNNPKLQDKPLVKFLHLMETPGKRFKALLNKKCEFDAKKVARLEKNLSVFMKHSGPKIIPDWINQQAQCKKELEVLENERQKKFMEDIAELDEVTRIISEIEFYQTKLEGHEHLNRDLQSAPRQPRSSYK